MIGNRQQVQYTTPRRRLRLLVIVIGMFLWTALLLVGGFRLGRRAVGATANPVHGHQRQDEPEPLPRYHRPGRRWEPYLCSRCHGPGLVWGINYYGQLGDNTTMSRSGAVPVIGLAGKAAAVWGPECQ